MLDYRGFKFATQPGNFGTYFLIPSSVPSTITFVGNLSPGDNYYVMILSDVIFYEVVLVGVTISLGGSQKYRAL